MKRIETALITGASRGIGYELACLFARDHYNLVIVSRDAEMLSEIAIELKHKGASSVKVIAADLATPGGPEKVFNTTQQLGIQIDVLVNDAGAGLHGKFIETNLEAELRIIQLNISSLVWLTKAYLQGMVQRRNGKILQLASISSFQPTPLLAVYAATKAFVLSFTDAITNELEDTGVTVTSLIPGATATDFFRKAHAEHTNAAQCDLEDPRVVARTGYAGLMNGDHHAVAPHVKSQIIKSTVLSNESVAKLARKHMEPNGEAA